MNPWDTLVPLAWLGAVTISKYERTDINGVCWPLCEHVARDLAELLCTAFMGCHRGSNYLLRKGGFIKC